MSDLVGLKVKLDRPVDRDRPCCQNLCVIGNGRSPHAGELRCADCGRHRGWLSKSTAQWIEHVATRFGAPTTPILVRKSHTYREETRPIELKHHYHSEHQPQLQQGHIFMRSSDAFPSKYLKSADVKAKQLVATICYVTFESVGQDKKQKPVIYLEDGKPFVCNRTNFEILEEAFGDSDEWPGHKLKVYCAPTSYQGKRVDGIRVEPVVPKPALKDDLNDEIAI
jgi:hypothetical protein